MTETIKDFYGKILGYIETTTDTSTGAVNKIAYDFYRRRLGTWDSKSNMTKDFFGRIVARGDTTSGLIYAEEEKNKQRNNKK